MEKIPLQIQSFGFAVLKKCFEMQRVEKDEKFCFAHKYFNLRNEATCILNCNTKPNYKNDFT